eukprot:GILJ01003403.1.p1 GENE.GILJ01003403.1~~GILJ01003403.1.p1  ORF type:complete len:257 (+),score=38.12 GILJ01003403.1:60-773(+)
MKLFLHYEQQQPFTLKVELPDDNKTTFGDLKNQFVETYRAKLGIKLPAQSLAMSLTRRGRTIQDRSLVAPRVTDGEDIFVKAQVSGTDADNALRANQSKRGDMSYYYAHRPGAAFVPAEPPKMVAKAETSRAETFHTLGSYSYEDADQFVSVSVSLDGVGSLPADQVTTSFASTSFELLIRNHNGKNYRFAVPRLHAAIVPSECSHRVRPNRVIVKLKKEKKEDHWFDLMKKKAIGE